MKHYMGRSRERSNSYLAAVIVAAAIHPVDGARRPSKPKNNQSESEAGLQRHWRSNKISGNDSKPANQLLSHSAITRIYSGPGANISQEFFQELLNYNARQKSYLNDGKNRPRRPKVEGLEKHLLMNLHTLDQPAGNQRQIIWTEEYDAALARVKGRRKQDAAGVLSDREIMLFGYLVSYAHHMEPKKVDSRILPISGVLAYRALEQAELWAEREEIELVKGLKEDLYKVLLSMRGKPRKISWTREERDHFAARDEIKKLSDVERQVLQLKLHLDRVGEQAEEIKRKSLAEMGLSESDYKDVLSNLKNLKNKK